MNKKVRKNLIAALVLALVCSVGFFTGNIWGFAFSSGVIVAMTAYILYLARYQQGLNREREEKRNERKAKG